MARSASGGGVEPGLAPGVAGRRTAPPERGFGKLWQRDFWTEVDGVVSPEALVEDWRTRFGDFWPRDGRFHGPRARIAPGQVAAVELEAAEGVWLATGVRVQRADERSFTFVTLEGHQFAATVTFSADRTPAGTRARVGMLLRTADPLFELAWPLVRRKESVFWARTLRNVAASYGAENAVVHSRTRCLDRRRLWRNWTSVSHNAGLRAVWRRATRLGRRADR